MLFKKRTADIRDLLSVQHRWLFPFSSKCGTTPQILHGAAVTDLFWAQVMHPCLSIRFFTFSAMMCQLTTSRISVSSAAKRQGIPSTATLRESKPQPARSDRDLQWLSAWRWQRSISLRYSTAMTSVYMTITHTCSWVTAAWWKALLRKQHLLQGRWSLASWLRFMTATG